MRTTLINGRGRCARRKVGNYASRSGPRQTSHPAKKLPQNINSMICNNLTREVGQSVCGRCSNGTGPSVSSVGSQCTCVQCNALNIHSSSISTSYCHFVAHSLSSD